MLDSFFNPKTIAVIGVSRDSKKFGHIIFKNLLDSGFEVYGVNPNSEEILGRKMYKSLLEIPKHIDLCVIVVPSKLVLNSIKECVSKNVNACIIISSGFSEIGNKEDEEKILEVAKGKMRIIGPNVIGVYDSFSKLDTIFNLIYRQERPHQGNIAFISQSGAFGAALLDWTSKEGIGISKFISIGNRIDVDEIDLLDYLDKDDKTKVITMYLEGTKNGRKLYHKLKDMSKPVIIVKAGKSKEGSKAALSHTGSMAGSYLIYSGMFKQANVIEAYNEEDMFDSAKAFFQFPKGKQIQIITNGGGFGIMAADAIKNNGLKLAQMKDFTNIKNVVPAFASLSNPIDLTGNGTSEMYKICIEECMKDENVDVVLVILLLQVSFLDSSIIEYLISKKFEKPIFVCMSGGEFVDVHKKILEKHNIPVYSSPERAAKSIRNIVNYFLNNKFRKSSGF